MRFDDFDRRILTLLQQDSSISMVDLADRVGLSHTPCWRRVRRMEEMGLIRGRVALVDRKLANVPLTIFMSVRAPRHSDTWLAAFRNLVAEVPEIVEAYRLTGDVDYLLRIVVPSIEVYDSVYKSLIARLEFSDLSSSIAMEEMKYSTAVPTNYL